MLSITCLLWLAAFVATIASAAGRCPLWVPVLLIAIAGLLSCLPLR
jgi:hypothetical protein